MNNRPDFGTTTAPGRAGVTYDEGLRSYMLGVYNYMGLGIAATAIIAFFFASNPDLVAMMRGNMLATILPFVGIIGIGFFAPRFIFSSSPATAHGIYWVYVALWGLLIGPSVAAYFGAGMGNLVYKAFFITSATFGALSLYGYTTKRDLQPMAKFLFMATIGLIIAMVLNFFIFKSGLMSFAISSLVVIVFSAITAYETQMVKNLYQTGGGEANKRASIFGAFMLYGSFVTLFIHILNILGFMQE